MPTPEELALLHPQTIGDPTVDNSAPVGPTGPAETPEQQRIAALEAQIAASAEREQRYLQTLDSFVSRGTAPAAPAAPVAPASFSLDDLPDAVQSPTEFKTKLVEKVNSFVTGSVQSATQESMAQMTRAQQLDNLWNGVRTRAPELAGRTALAQGAAAVTFNDLRARGIDPFTVMAQNPDSLVGSIITRMQAELGTAAAPATPGASGARAASVAAGSVAPGGAPAPAKPPSFVEQHNNARRVLGIGY